MDEHKHSHRLVCWLYLSRCVYTHTYLPVHMYVFLNLLQLTKFRDLLEVAHSLFHAVSILIHQ